MSLSKSAVSRAFINGLRKGALILFRDLQPFHRVVPVHFKVGIDNIIADIDRSLTNHLPDLPKYFHRIGASHHDHVLITIISLGSILQLLNS